MDQIDFFKTTILNWILPQNVGTNKIIIPFLFYHYQIFMFFNITIILKTILK